MTPQPRTLFISYASPDRGRVTPYCDWLQSRGFDVWIDHKRLKPGQNWDFVIRRELDRAAIILIFLSKESVDRQGYAQREIKLALDKAEEKLAEDIYIIPIILDDDARIPDQIKPFHCVRASAPNCRSLIEDAVSHKLGTIRAEIDAAQDRAKLQWTIAPYSETWDGLPGYEFQYELYHFTSEQYPKVGDITVLIHGRLMEMLMDSRKAKFSQAHGSMNFGQDKFLRTNTVDVHCFQPSICGKVLSIQYAVHWYGAGAAHANMHFMTYSFFLDPVVHIQDLRHIFTDANAGLAAIQSEVRRQLLSAAQGEGISASRDADWVTRGTEDWNCFNSFVFRETAIEISFPPYQVDCYAAGPQFVRVDYQLLIAMMEKEYAEALGLSHLLWRLANEKS
jgi:hypothetical protein